MRTAGYLRRIAGLLIRHVAPQSEGKRLRLRSVQTEGKGGSDDKACKHGVFSLDKIANINAADDALMTSGKEEAGWRNLYSGFH